MSMEIGRTEAIGIQNPSSRTDRLGVAPPLQTGLSHQGGINDADQDAYPAPLDQNPQTLADELACALGLDLTRRNPVWGPTALDRLRALQHTLMKKAFSLPQDERAPTLQAVKCLEVAVNLRLRLEEVRQVEQVVVHNKLNQLEATPPSGTKSARI